MEFITPEMMELFKALAIALIASLPGIYAVRKQQQKNKADSEKAEAEATESITRSAGNVVNQYKEITDIYKRQIIEIQLMLDSYKKENSDVQKTLDDLKVNYARQTDALMTRMARLETIIKVLVDQLQEAGLKPNADLDDILNGHNKEN